MRWSSMLPLLTLMKSIKATRFNVDALPAQTQASDDLRLDWRHDDILAR